MSNNLGQITINNMKVIETDSDPSTGGGLVAAIGSLALVNDGAGLYYKNGAGNTAWIVEPRTLQDVYDNSTAASRNILEASDDPVRFQQPTANGRVAEFENTSSGTTVPVIIGNSNPTTGAVGNYPKGALYISDGAVANIYVHNTAGNNTDWKLYQAFTQKIIDAAGLGDYTSVATAVSTEGIDTLFFIKAGTYNETSDIVLKSGQVLIGENKNSVIIQLAATEVLATGDSGGQAGTVSTTTGSTALVGVGTDFTVYSPGTKIIIRGIIYDVDTVTDATNLNLVETFNGQALSGEDFDAINTAFLGNILENITFEIDGSTKFGWMARIEQNINMVQRNVIWNGKNVAAEQGCIRFVHGYNTLFDTCEFIDNTGDGINMSNERSYLIKFINCTNRNNGSNGLDDSRMRNSIVESCYIQNNAAQGVRLSGDSQRNKYVDNDVTGNGTHGFDFDVDSLLNSVIANNRITANDDIGLRLDLVQGVVIDGNDISDNGSDGIQMVSTATVQQISMTSNQVKDNGGTGINIINAGNLTSLVVGNIVQGNTSAQITDNALDTVNANNQV